MVMDRWVGDVFLPDGRVEVFLPENGGFGRAEEKVVVVSSVCLILSGWK